MNELLKKLAGQRAGFRGTVYDFGSMPHYGGEEQRTVILNEVHDQDGQYIGSKYWLPIGKSLAALSLQKGDIIEFEAKVTPYQRPAYEDNGNPYATMLDYKFTYPTKMRKIN